jgi:16S rRNA (uracil1498-N3)-methyltransferase
MKHPPWLLAPEQAILETGQRLMLSAAEARHATGALRLTTGRPVVLTDGRGSVAHGVLALASRARVEVVIERVEHLPKPTECLTLAVAVLTGSAMDMVVQKSVELGVGVVLPVRTERSQLSLKRAASRCGHWRRISEQALKQCRRAWAMEIASPVELGDVVGGGMRPFGVVAHSDGRPIDELPSPRGRLLLVGPEGGFSAGEERCLEAAGWPRVSLGPHVLRTDTAAIVGSARLIALLESRSGLHSSDV